jgi:hypothetical protein
MSTKIELGLRMLGLTSQQRSDLDSIIAMYGSSPVVSTLLGEVPTNLSGVLSSVINLSSDSSEIGKASRKVARIAMRTSDGRRTIANMITKFISSSPHQDTLTEVLRKISDLPLPGFGNVEYPDGETFIAEGLLPTVDEYLTEEDDDIGTGAIGVSCPYCSQNFVHHVFAQ